MPLNACRRTRRGRLPHVSRSWVAASAVLGAVLACAASAFPAEPPAPAAESPPPSVAPENAPSPIPSSSAPVATPPTTAEPSLPSNTTDRETEATHTIHYQLEAIEVRGNSRTRARIIRRFIKIRVGDVFDVENPELELTRFRLLGTGFFREVNLSLRKGSRRGAVVLVVDVAERNTIVVSDLWMGLSADADTRGNARPLTAYAGADVAETNLAGTGITLGAGLGIARDQLALRARFFDPSFLGTRWMASASLLHNEAREFYGNRDVLYDDPANAAETVQDYAVVKYRRFGGTIGVGRDISLPMQLWLDYRLERVNATLPLAASHRRGLDIEPIEFGLNPGPSVLSTLRGTFQHDTRDMPVLTTRGNFTTVTADISLSPLGSSYPYHKLTVNASQWFELPWRHVLRLNLFAGVVAGYAPIYERFYVGDFSDFLPNRMLDLNVDRRPAPNFLGTDIVEVRYGEYAARLQGDYRIRLYRGRRSVYGVDLFGSAGLYGVASRRDLTDPPRGYRGMARVPVDLTFNVGLLIDTNAGGFTFAFSNVLGFIPVRSEARP